EIAGYEADDIIGTLTAKADQQGIQTLVISGDKDMLQLASSNVTIAVTRKGVSEVELYSPDTIQEKYGLKPEQIIDLKGLMGDTSDNIPGVPGVGEKTALKLLHQFPTVEEVLANLDAQKGKLKENLTNHQQSALMSKQLATIFREVPITLTEEQMSYSGYDSSTLAEQLRKLEFKSLLERLDVSVGSSSNQEEATQALEAL